MSQPSSPTPPPAPTKHLSAHALAERWDTSVGHLANLRSKGDGPPYLKPSGSRVIYRLADIEAHEAAALVKTASAA